jgi:hypothetical protein
MSNSRSVRKRRHRKYDRRTLQCLGERDVYRLAPLEWLVFRHCGVFRRDRYTHHEATVPIRAGFTNEAGIGAQALLVRTQGQASH